MVGTPARSGPCTVVVSGDVTMDWNLAREPLRGDTERSTDTRASWQRGGAALLADLVRAVVRGPEDAASVDVRAVEAPDAPIPPGDDMLNHSYAIWSPFRVGDGAGRGHVWRAASYLGIDRARGDDAVRTEWQHMEAAVPHADVVVLDDAALGFRDLSDAGVWRRAFGAGHPWVVLKQARPVATGPLWEHLLAEAADRLLVVLTVDDLRGRDVQVSRGLSWERTAQDLLWELVHKPTVNPLSRVAHTVVSFGAAGAALLSGPTHDSPMPTCTLFFDPERVEGEWDAEHPGRVMGGTDCLTAALVRELVHDPEAPCLDRGIQAGVAAARRLHLDGYEERGAGRMELGFPISAVAEEVSAGHQPLQQVEVPDPAGADAYWTILQARHTGNLAAEAVEIATRGPERALGGVPLGRFGKLVTADRSEIEAFRSVGALIAEYMRHPQPRPLSIAVFGPPGSGKSFGVKQVARAVAGGEVGDPLEFNLAQLRDPDELADAFHLVRDEALGGAVPLVFWDEFDTPLHEEPLGWLRHFLAPMQDGEFRQGQLVHPIGRAIFVFAGGTCARMGDFATATQTAAARQAKGPDFVSRLKGYIDVLGPNPQGDADAFHMIRRAILLRSMLQRSAPALVAADGTLRVDPGVLRAFLETEVYRHGARSMEAVIAMSQLSGVSTFERSSLPPGPQLDLHVEARDFLALVQRPELEGDLLERLARAAHRVYREELEQHGYVPGDTADDEHQVSDSLVAYDELPAHKQQQSRDTVRDIPTKLARIGCVMVPSRADLAPAKLSDDEVEVLAREEHARWMRDLGPGWRHGESTDKDRRIHEAYLPWDDLPEQQRDKDRDLVRGIPTILHEAGYAVVRTHAPEATEE